MIQILLPHKPGRVGSAHLAPLPVATARSRDYVTAVPAEMRIVEPEVRLRRSRAMIPIVQVINNYCDVSVSFFYVLLWFLILLLLKINQYLVITQSYIELQNYEACFTFGAYVSLSVDGSWGAWNTWGACSVSCDQGTRHRSRVCDDPAPLYGGKTCAGSDSETGNCQIKECPRMFRSGFASL